MTFFLPPTRALQCYESCTDRSLGLHLDLDFPDTGICISISQESQSAWSQIWVQAQADFYFFHSARKICNTPKCRALTKWGRWEWGEREGSVLSCAGSQKARTFLLVQVCNCTLSSKALHLLQENCQSSVELLDLTCGWLLTFRTWEHDKEGCRNSLKPFRIFNNPFVVWSELAQLHSSKLICTEMGSWL